MFTKQVVAVIGASGNMGSAIAKNLSKGNYRILLHSSKTNKVQSLINEIKVVNPFADIEIVDDYVELCWEADIIIAAVPFGVEKEVAENIRKVVNQKVVISISNPLNDTYTGLITAPGTSAAEELQKKLPQAKVIKAFNTTFAEDFYQPAINGLQVDCFVAGNDEEALHVVFDLVKTAGFNPVLAGDLSASRTLESMQLLLIQLTMQNKYNWIAGWKILHN
jgi:8-hydroxy-5-deazaflavin:NADPH oxidoreductase